MATAARRSTIRSDAYSKVEEKIAAQRCVILDGGVATELQRNGGLVEDTGLWGTWAL